MWPDRSVLIGSIATYRFLSYPYLLRNLTELAEACLGVDSRIVYKVHDRREVGFGFKIFCVNIDTIETRSNSFFF